MKYTDGLFSFPVKVYDGLSLKRAIEEEQNTDVPTDGDWVSGHARVPVDEIKGWFDVFSKGKTIDDVVEKGFDGTIILTRTMGEFECIWERTKFEERLDNFVEKYTNKVDNYIEQVMAEKRSLMPIIKKKRYFWSSWLKK